MGFSAFIASIPAVLSVYGLPCKADDMLDDDSFGKGWCDETEAQFGSPGWAAPSCGPVYCEAGMKSGVPLIGGRFRKDDLVLLEGSKVGVLLRIGGR